MIRVAATIYGLVIIASILSSKSKPITADGIQATMILSHNHNLSLSQQSLAVPLFLLTGQSFLKYITTTARIAPSWITTLNILINSWPDLRLRNCPNRIRCPVLLTGSHSVIPSTIPRTTIFTSSVKDITLSHCQLHRQQS